MGTPAAVYRFDHLLSLVEPAADDIHNAARQLKMAGKITRPGHAAPDRLIVDG